MTNLPTPYAAARIAAFLDDHLSWSAYWDKHYGLWRVAEDDPHSDLYAESRDADVVIRYISAHSRDLQFVQRHLAGGCMMPGRRGWRTRSRRTRPPSSALMSAPFASSTAGIRQCSVN